MYHDRFSYVFDAKIKQATAHLYITENISKTTVYGFPTTHSKEGSNGNKSIISEWKRYHNVTMTTNI